LDYTLSRDTEIATVEVTSADELDMEYVAKTTAETLNAHYPDHLWAVGWAPGRTLVVKNMAMDGRYGYTIDANKSFSATQLAHAAMMAGGELLERMGMRRGRWDGSFAENVDKS